MGSPAVKSQKKIKEPNAPKAPLGAFFQFQHEERLNVKTENPSFSNPEISKELGRRWKEMEPEAKKVYQDKAVENKKQYEENMAAYKLGNYNPGSNNEIQPPSAATVTNKSIESDGDKQKSKKSKKRPRSPSPSIVHENTKKMAMPA